MNKLKLLWSHLLIVKDHPHGADKPPPTTESLPEMWRQASLIAGEGILPPGKTTRKVECLKLAAVCSFSPLFRRAGSHASMSAKMADATNFRQALSRSGTWGLFKLTRAWRRKQPFIQWRNFPMRKAC